MMSVLKTIKNRRSIREFKDRPITQDLIDQLIEALIWAPSAGNLQSRKFYFVFNQKIRERLSEAALDQDFIAQAPLVVVGCADQRIESRYGQRGVELYRICDVAVSIENMMLLAQEQGLGTCWVGAFNEKQVASILNLPNNLRPIAIVPVGYPDEQPSPPSRVPPGSAVEFVE